ncbi:hypothetical protein QYF36_014156 [Acer negundo]|nr:hypothetical protein QYF36_014156 [Acer negundo]
MALRIQGHMELVWRRQLGRWSAALLFHSAQEGVHGSRISRRVGSGTWAGEDSGDTITSQNYVVGVKKRFRYENKKSPDNGAWIMHEFAVDPSLLRQHQKLEDIVLCRMKKNPVAEKKKKRKLQQVLNSEPCMLQQVLNSEPCTSSKRSKLVEPQPVPISVQQYQQEAEFNSQHTGSNIETEPVDARLMYCSHEEEELLITIDQHLGPDNISDDEPCMSSKLVEPLPVPISVQQQAEFNSKQTGSNIETEPVYARLLEEEELLYSIELDQLLKSEDDESKAAETQEISAKSSSSRIDDVYPADTTTLMFDPQEFLLYGFEEEEFLLYSPDQFLYDNVCGK